MRADHWRNPSSRRVLLQGVLVLAALVAAAVPLAPCRAQTTPPGTITLDRPGPRDFILDRANLLAPADRERIKKICDKLLTEKAVPIIVVTIDSMGDYGGAGMRIETFATLLFNQWGIGQPKVNDQSWNRGILLLVSKNDRKARIELGADWRHDQDVLAQSIMNDQIVPKFKAGDFSGGIAAGVEALDKMARGLQLPKAVAPPVTWQQTAIVLALAGVAVFTVVSLIRHGTGGWAWLMWGAIFAAVGYLIYSLVTNRSGSGDGGGFSGGSFGGGFSGGGGASGSW